AAIMLLVLRPVRAGEFVAIGCEGSGTADGIGFFMPRFVQDASRPIVLPNTLVWGVPITNYSRNMTRRLDARVGVRYDDDLEAALAALQGLVDQHEGILADPAPQVMVMEYRDSTIMVNIRAWTPADQYWDVYFDLHRHAPQALRQAGLRSPIPLREVKSVPAPVEKDKAAHA